ncbi:galactosylgalactosylxylosylprotein 3-beta-glucuronosyltransferase P isoform X1 [Bactrocera tryoni]|uniref:galactosylgalactosylxylosylprotein 3-beta-glucuronosyltransferase P isoform X1 n=1 Tax=Bactrocera tryoni TaxID=59916 RepID=UPI001A98A25D|nr:galactosylgalactosylxylosylprotein 3-beta-glucuronosyltransferase P isoform X1 [Bactrocera tryoni]
MFKKGEKMALAKSLKMFLTIFVATTCIYMVLYQYHLSREPITQPKYIKNKDISADADVAAIARKYNSYLWSPMSLFSARQPQQQQQVQTPEAQTPLSISERQSNATTSDSATTTHAATERKSAALTVRAAAQPLSSPLQATTQHNISTSNSSSSFVSVTPTSTTTHTLSTSVVSARLLNDSLGSARQQFIAQNVAAVDSLRKRSTALATLNSTTNARTTTKTTTIRTIATTRAVANAANSTLPNARIVTRPAVGTTANDTKALPPPLYIITPTYRRAEQLAELTRLGYTLKHVVNLLWLVIEDANQTSPLVIHTLNRIGVPYEYFLAPMPDEYKNTKKAKPRGVSNRNRGLDYIRANATSGVFYFADDDNTYDISIFEQMRYTQKVSMWPVGLVTKFGVSTPIIRDGKITGFYDGWIGGRKFPVDMAGFAVSVKFLHERPNAKMPFKAGYEEDGFLKSLAPLNLTDIELLASNCTEILTWHTQTKKNANASPLNLTLHGDTNLVSLNTFLVRT